MFRIIRILIFLSLLLSADLLFAQRISSKYRVNSLPLDTDSLALRYRLRTQRNTNPYLRSSSGIYLKNPVSYEHLTLYNDKTHDYKVEEKIGSRQLFMPNYYTIPQYQQVFNKNYNRVFWNSLFVHRLDTGGYNEDNLALARSIEVESAAFRLLFGGTKITIKPAGWGDLSVMYKINKNDNPLLAENLRSQGIFDFEPRIQMSLNGDVGTKLHVTFNYNSQAQFNFENQFKISYDVLGEVNSYKDAKVEKAKEKTKEKAKEKLSAQVAKGGKIPTVTANEMVDNTVEEATSAVATGLALHDAATSSDRSTANRLAERLYKEDGILKKIEFGYVNMNLPSTLITGSQALLGVKTQLQFGRLMVTGVFSQQKSQFKEITIKNGAQQGEFKIQGSNYDANRHYFLAHFFRNRYKKALDNITMINSGVNITKIEVWVTNRNNSNQDSRDILALMDLGEQSPYNTTLVSSGSSIAPAASLDKSFSQQSNNLLTQLSAINARSSASSAVVNFFAQSGAESATVNYARVNYARRLTEREYTLNTQLGYISLNAALNSDEILAVAFRYTYNGEEYQVGEFSTDVPVNSQTPNVLYVKMLKNSLLKTDLPIWKLMMKNIYSLDAYQIKKSNFKLNISRADPKSGIEKMIMTEGGSKIKGKLWIQVLSLDKMNLAGDNVPDGVFDFMDNVTVDPVNGKVILPMLEPFGSDLSESFSDAETSLKEQYVFEELYKTTKIIAKQNYAVKDRFYLQGTFESQAGSEISLGAINVPEGSVSVMAGSSKLVEGIDFRVDYMSGRLTMLNTAILNSGQPLTIRLENNELFGLQQKIFTGLRLDYKVNRRLNIGGTWLHLSETPLVSKFAIGDEPIANTIWGMDVKYEAKSRLLTRLVDNIPFISTKEPSKIDFYGEIAQFIPGHPSALGSAGTSYIDDFEGAKYAIDIKSPYNWQIAPTPLPTTLNGNKFSENSVTDDWAYNKNRAKLAFYSIDPLFYGITSAGISVNMNNSSNILSNHYVRQVTEQEIFPNKSSYTGTDMRLATLDLAYYPNIRGPYNFDTNINTDGTLLNPTDRFGAIFRRMDTNDFESQNVSYLEFWVLNPFMDDTGTGFDNINNEGGDLFINIGNISEDILKDGEKSIENGLPATDTDENLKVTKWARIPKQQPVVQAFSTDAGTRRVQDVGLDGMNDDREQTQFKDFLNSISNADVLTTLKKDPASDNFMYFRGSTPDGEGWGVLKRYENYNGTEGNSKTSDQANADFGVTSGAATPYPDVEDVNKDNTMNLTNQYYEYKVSLRKTDFNTSANFVPSGYIVDRISKDVALPNGLTKKAYWFQFKIPINDPNRVAVGGIEDMRSIRFVRLYLTNFADTTVLRFGRLQFTRGDWRNYNQEKNSANDLKETGITTSDLSTSEVGVVNIEENANRSPVPYQLPPGVNRQRDINNTIANTLMNEQSLSLMVKNLYPGFARATYRTITQDLRSYKKLQIYVHAEAIQNNIPVDNDLRVFVRLGSDNQNNYYEYEIPIKITAQKGSYSAYDIWPSENNISFEFNILTALKKLRTEAKWDITVPYIKDEGGYKRTIMGFPDLSKVKVIMLGVRNPKSNSSAKDVIVWFDELRVSEYNEDTGWGMLGNINTKLADFGTVNLSGKYTTANFGSLSQKVNQRPRSDDSQLDVLSNFELGMFFPKKALIRVPTMMNISRMVSTPQYDPRNPDVLMSEVPSNERNILIDYNLRRAISFNNVRKDRAEGVKKHFWDIENWSYNYSYNEAYQHTYIIEKDFQQTYRTSLLYNYPSTPKNYQPLSKFNFLQSKYMQLVRDFNYTLAPSSVGYKIELIRQYAENTPRDLSSAGAETSLPVFTTYNKAFYLNWNYNLTWNLTRSIALDFSALNNAVVDEPAGPITKEVKDSIWSNLKRMGRTTDYSHSFNANYTLPFSKIPGLDWINVVARYGSTYAWKSMSLAVLKSDHQIGNTIQNSRTMQLSPNFVLTSLYKKSAILNEWMNDKTNTTRWALINILTSVKTIGGSYAQTEGIFMPGYMPKTNYLGLDRNYFAPGIPFIFGSQSDIRASVAEKGWLSKDELLNQPYNTTYKSDLSLKSMVQPISDFRIDVTGMRLHNKTYSSLYKYSAVDERFVSITPVENGNFSISFISILTSFKSGSSIVSKFISYRPIYSTYLANANPNSVGKKDGYSDGYSKDQQEVSIRSFLAAYSGLTPNSAKEKTFPSIPLPNWSLYYTGLSNVAFLKPVFKSITLSHSYKSIYSINSYNTLARYTEAYGSSSNKDANGDFLPQYQISQVSINEQFAPFIGLDMRFQNNISAKISYNKGRIVGLSTLNSQISEQTTGGFDFGIGYKVNRFRFPFGMFNGLILKNTLEFKLDFSIRDNITVIYRPNANTQDVSSGSNILVLKPSIDYMISKQLSIRFFYDQTINKPYTSQTFTTSFISFGFNIKFNFNQ